MIGLVDNGWLVGLCFPCHIQHVIGGNLIGCNGSYLTGESVLTIFCFNSQLQDGVANLFGCIYLVHPTCGTTTMQTVRTIVLLQLVSAVVQRELTFFDAVGIAANAGTVVARRVQRVSILGNIIETQHHIGRLTILVRNNKADNTTTVVGDTNLHTIGILQRKKFDGLFVDKCVEICWIKTRDG